LITSDISKHSGVKDISGNKFGKLTVVSFSHISSKRQAVWNCICDCGNPFIIEGISLTRGNTRSCGCLNLESARKQGKLKQKSFVVDGFRNCVTCKETFPLCYFAVKNSCEDGYNATCKECVRFIKIKSLYGLSKEDFFLLLEKQNHICPICNLELIYRHSSCEIPNDVHVDHCHATGKVRGLLHDRCNRTLGTVEKNLPILDRMIDYIKGKV
jgi:hypothetical protein